MQEIVSYCGLLCVGCPIFIASKETDPALKTKMKVEIAKTCNNLYNTEYNADDITECEGCLSVNGKLFPSCTECRIRNCAMIHQVQNCAHCDEYPCETINEFFKDNPESKARLDFIKAIL